MWERLDQLLAWLQTRRPNATGRSVVDTAPLLERDFARLAGLGWIAKNTMLIHPRLGSFTVLGALLTDCELEVDLPFEYDRCGTCTRCLDACPTSAFTAPGRLDSRRCISYWTIEHRGPIPDAWADQLHGWVFGCDVCQEVCPWNRKAPAGTEPWLAPRADLSELDLLAWLEADPAQFREQIRGTALQRAKRVGLVRNAALVLGTRREARAEPALIRLLDDSEPVIRAAAAWALGRLATLEAQTALLAHAQDPDPEVQNAIRSALKGQPPIVFGDEMAEAADTP
jgi:epoxyqueuosine reductase